MNRGYEVCIIGGGASGLACAASLDRGIRACILEKNEILGRKILATGGGRCNLSNAGCRGVSASLDFFASCGLEVWRDSEGRYYPYSGCAADVVEALTGAIDKTYIDVMTSTAVTSIRRVGQTFRIQVEVKRDPKGRGRQVEITAGQVVVAAGGKAAPQFGTTGDGYGLVKSLGHHVSRLYPILTGITCGDFPDLAGIRARGSVGLLKDGRRIAQERGEIQFTKDGVSGICVFNLTPQIRAEEGETPADALRRYHLELDLAPDFTQEYVSTRGSSRGIVTRALAERVSAQELKHWRLPVRGIKGWKSAQCTGGGVPLAEVDPATQGSRIVPGLYLTGEILDAQGPCGGYNLQHAWETGIRAARGIHERLAGHEI